MKISETEMDRANHVLTLIELTEGKDVDIKRIIMYLFNLLSDIILNIYEIEANIKRLDKDLNAVVAGLGE